MSRVLDLFIWSLSLLQIEVAVLSLDSILSSLSSCGSAWIITVILSANIIHSMELLRWFGNEFIYTRKSRGPRTEPCGTP